MGDRERDKEKKDKEKENELSKLLAQGGMNYLKNVNHIAQYPDNIISRSLQVVHMGRLKEIRNELYKKYNENLQIMNPVTLRSRKPQN
jgi:hypothetical protein